MTGFSKGGYIPGPPTTVTTYRHDDHWALTPKRFCDTSGFCDRILTKEEITRWWSRDRLPA